MKNIIFFLLVAGMAIGCADNQSEISKTDAPYYSSIIKKDAVKILSIDNKILNEAEKKDISEENTIIGKDNFFLFHEGKTIIVNRAECVVTVLDPVNKNILSSFSFKGKGFGLCNRIHAGVVLDTTMLFYYFRAHKFVEYTFDGKLVNEITPNLTDYPTNINCLIRKEGTHFLTAGGDNNWWSDYNNDKEYSNLFAFNLGKNRILWDEKIHPEYFALLEKGDVGWHTALNKFQLRELEDSHLFFDRISGEIMKLAISDTGVTKVRNYIIPKDVFKRKMAMQYSVYRNYDTDDWKKWARSGHNMLDVFVDGEYMICAFSNYNHREEKYEFGMYFINSQKEEIEYIINIEGEKHLKHAAGGKLFLLGYQDEENIGNDITLFEIDYTELL